MDVQRVRRYEYGLPDSYPQGSLPEACTRRVSGTFRVTIHNSLLVISICLNISQIVYVYYSLVLLMSMIRAWLTALLQCVWCGYIFCGLPSYSTYYVYMHSVAYLSSISCYKATQTWLQSPGPMLMSYSFAMQPSTDCWLCGTATSVDRGTIWKPRPMSSTVLLCTHVIQVAITV